MDLLRGTYVSHGFGERRVESKISVRNPKGWRQVLRQALMIFGYRYRRWNSKTIFQLRVQNVVAAPLCLRQACLGGYEVKQVRVTGCEDETCFGFFG
jgi:hypothetical protein